MADNDIRCPICNLNLQVLTERKREEHCDACLDNCNIYEPNSSTDDSIQVAGGSAARTRSLPNTPIKRENNETTILKANSPSLSETPQQSTFSQSHTTTWSDLLGKRARDDGSRGYFDLKQDTKKRTGNNSKRIFAREKSKIPFYKILSFGSTKIAVDAFNYGSIDGVDSYFLSHFHADHYGGLSKSWCHGLIYCSASTARLVILKLKVKPEYIRPLELRKDYQVNGVNVCLFDANHCPGAAVFLFNNHTLHTGDFRATKQLIDELRLSTSVIQSVYLDTTYLDPNRRFPAQDTVVEVCATFCAQMQAEKDKPSFFIKTPSRRRILVMVGTYTIGKERLALAISQKLNTKIWAEPWKQKILEVIGDPRFIDPLCDDGTEAQVHLTSMGALSLPKLEKSWSYLRKHFTHLVAFVPTGWTWPASGTEFDMKTLQSSKASTVSKDGSIRICRVPYSEHSSYDELEYFCRSVPCRKLIPTVHTKRHDLLRQWEVPI